MAARIKVPDPIPADPREWPDTLFLSVDILGLSLGTLHALNAQKIFYLGELLKKSEAELEQIPSISLRLYQIKQGLARWGLKLRDS